MIEIPLQNTEKRAIVDDNFFYLSNFKWQLSPRGYVRGTIKKGKRVFLHRLIMKAQKGQILDHKNNNPLDNQIENLRFCSQRQNVANQVRTKRKYSKYKGVTYSITEKRKKRWTASCEYDNKEYRVGRFHTEKEAVDWYNKKAKELWGDFAKLNVWDGITEWSPVYIKGETR